MNGGYAPSRFASAVGWAVALFLLLPITIVLPVSLTDQRYLSLPHEGLSLQHYRKLFTSPEWLALKENDFMDYRLRVHGLVEHPLTLDWQAFSASLTW